MRAQYFQVDGTTLVNELTLLSLILRFQRIRVQGANVYLASAELAAVSAMTGKIPSPEEYLAVWQRLREDSSDTYRYLNFDQIEEYRKIADSL